MMRALFLLSLSLLAFTYAGYPLLMWLLARLRPRPLAPEPTGDPPTVSVIIPARDEAQVIGAKIESVLAQADAASRLELIVVDDGSRDATAQAAAAAGATCDRVRVLERAAPSGKATALN